VSRSIAGLIGLNCLFALTGLCLLWALRGWRSWLDLLEHLGVALMLGIGSVGVLATLVLVAGQDLSLWLVLVLCAVVALPSAEIAVLRRRRLPRALGRLPKVASPGAIAALGLLLLTAALLVELYRVARVNSFVTDDAYVYWIPKAKVIYFFGGIDGQLFRTLHGASYPLLVPALDAIDFQFMGSADVPNLAIQSWFLLAGCLAAAAALLRPLVRPWLIGLFLVLATVLPNLDARVYLGEADWTVDFFFVLGALLLVRWVLAPEAWLLVGYGVMLAATFAAKREGALFAACLVGGALLATVRTPRRWGPLLGATAAAYATSVPWHIWWSSRQLQPDMPSDWLHNLVSNLDRIRPAYAVVFRLLFTYDFWLVAVPVALGAAVLCLTIAGPARQTAVLYVTTMVLGVNGLMWIVWSELSVSLDTNNATTPIPRAVGSLVLLSALLAPLLIEPLLAPPARVPASGTPVPDPLGGSVEDVRDRELPPVAGAPTPGP
jgi:hypothetical protein